jgi:serine/threonine-protein kinase
MIGRTISHYKILSKLGEGGMGVVYKAEDTKLGRVVALKFLPAEMTKDPEAKQRFVREAQSASSLSHPHITTIYEIDEAEEQTFIAMECVEGESLKKKIHAGPLKLDEAIGIAIQLAEGLQEAHEKGIVHRDIKPDNVMLTPKSQAKIMDFGLARSAGKTTLTKEGTTLGTVAYMSPEQARGEHVDHRTDIWSLGVVLYEMIVGRLPFRGDHEPAIVYSILNEDPEPPTTVRTGVPMELEKIVKKTLAKKPSERYQHAADLIVDLKSTARESGARAGRNMARPPARAPRLALRMWLPVALVIVAAVTSAVILVGRSQNETAQRQKSIAVLPFENMSESSDDEYFSDGLAEDIIDALTQVPGLRVTARTSAFSFRGQKLDVREIGARLGVEHILEGSVRRSGNRLRVTAQLVKASDGYHLWSQRFDREMTDVFAIQDEISQAIVEKLRVRLAEDRPLVKRHTESMEAYNLFLRGRHSVLRMTPESLPKGREYLEQAIAIDPDYALAYAGMAESSFYSALWGYRNPKEDLLRTKSAAMEALRRDETLAEAHSMLGLVLGILDFDWEGAELEFRRALELNPASPIVRYSYGFWLLRPTGRLNEALLHVQEAVRLDPLSPNYNAWLGALLASDGQVDRAVEQYMRAIELDPSLWRPHWLLAMTYVRTRRFEDAIAEANKACELSGGTAATLGTLGLAYALMGRRAEAEALLEQLTERSRTDYITPVAIALIHVGLKDTDRVLEWLEKGVEERDVLTVSVINSERQMLGVTLEQPRYRALLRKMNLEP